jgi:parvulin-like peptidyl-prolyl isomerase
MMEGQQIEQEAGREGDRKAPRSRVLWGAAGIVLVAAAVFGAWLGFSGAWKAWGAVATLDGKRIARAELDQHLDYLTKQGRLRPEAMADPARRKEAERAALDDLITRRVLLAEAQRLKIVVGPGEEDVAFRTAHGGQPGEFKLADMAKKKGEDVDRLREEVRGQLLMTRLAEKITEDVRVSDEDAAKYYEAHRQSFTAPGEAHLRLLIVESKEDAEKLRAQAVKGADFAALVRQYGKGGHKENGGDMGWVDSRMLPATIAKAVEAIPQTGVTPVIEAKGGFYLLRVEGRRPPREVPLAEVKDRLVQMVTAERKQARFAEWLEERRRAAKIEIYL